MKRKIRPVIFAVTVLIKLMALQPSSAGTLYPIAVTGQAVPDGNGLFGGQGNVLGFTGPTLNNRGVVCFHANVTGSTGAYSAAGIFCGTPGINTQVARGGQFPGILAGGQFEILQRNSGAINDSGQVAFKIGVTPPVMNFSTDAVFRKGGGRDSFSLFARRADPAPGEGTFDGLSDTRWRPVLGSAGHVAFQADLLGTDGGTSDNAGVFRSNAEGNVVVRVVQKGDIVSGGTQPISFFSQPVVNASGQVAVSASLGRGDAYEAIVRGNGNELVTIARKGQAIPGLGTIDNLGLQRASINDDGDVAFCLSNTNTNTAKALAVWSDTGSLQILAVVGEAVPTMTNRNWFAIDSSPSINASGQTGYIGRIRSISNPGPIYDVLFLDQTAVAVTGEPLPGGGGVFSSLTNMPFALNDSAQFAFRARITLDGFSGASYGIFFQDGAGGLFEVIRRGRSFLGSSITTVDFAGTADTEGLQPGMNGLNNAGEVAFRFELADGREGIALWSSLPKPTSGGSGQIHPVAGGFQVRFPGIPGWDYVIERDEDLVPPWSLLPARRANDAGWITFDDLGPGLPEKRFYRCAEAP